MKERAKKSNFYVFSIYTETGQGLMDGIGTAIKTAVKDIYILSWSSHQEYKGTDALSSWLKHLYCSIQE